MAVRMREHRPLLAFGKIIYFQTPMRGGATIFAWEYSFNAEMGHLLFIQGSFVIITSHTETALSILTSFESATSQEFR